MAYWNYALTLLLTYFGLFFGIILAQIAPEELRYGKKYFTIFKYLILGIILLIFSFQMLGLYYGVISVISMLFLIYYIVSVKTKEINDILAYVLLSFVFYFSFQETTIALLQTGLIILFGFPVGTLIRYKLIKKHWKYSYFAILKNYGIYLVIGLILPSILF
jgi:hypothetical protein